jgi:hypothetical protein
LLVVRLLARLLLYLPGLWLTQLDPRLLLCLFSFTLIFYLYLRSSDSVFFPLFAIKGGRSIPSHAGDCHWCPELPVRLKQLHTHWLSRSHRAVLFRGAVFNDRRVSFILFRHQSVVEAGKLDVTLNQNATLKVVPAKLQVHCWLMWLFSHRSAELLPSPCGV